MKKVVFALLGMACSISLFSCKENPQPNSILIEKDNAQGDVLLVEDPEPEDLALAHPSELRETYLYVTAISGLSLREHNNLQSKKLGKIPYGTRVKVIQAEPLQTMNVAGIPGGMDKIQYNHKQGYAFNGYLSRYFPPERDINTKAYAQELKEFFPEIIYLEHKGGTASAPTTTQTLSLPNATWHEAFFIAQRLYDFPEEFEFPDKKGKTRQVIQDKNPKRDRWTSQLEISRNKTDLTQIAYVYSSKKYDSKVTIERVGNVLKLSRIETSK